MSTPIILALNMEQECKLLKKRVALKSWLLKKRVELQSTPLWCPPPLALWRALAFWRDQPSPLLAESEQQALAIAVGSESSTALLQLAGHADARRREGLHNRSLS
jgi:hypothetical protein